MAALLVCLAAAAAGLVVMTTTLVRSRRVAPDIGSFMGGIGFEEPADGLRVPFTSRILGALLRTTTQRLETLLPGQYLEKLDRQLAQAGKANKRRAGTQLSIQIGLAVGGLALVPFLPTSSPATSLAALLLMPAMGFMLPSVSLKRQIRTRSEKIFKDLPDIVDMLAIAVEAGSGFETALSIVAKNFDSPLCDELNVALQEMELGLPRKEALQNLRERVDLDVVRTLVLSLLQADALGIPIGRVLKTQATEVRARRRAWAREKAAKLPVKIMFPLVLFIFPPILALVLGPAAGSFSKLGS